ncbi:MAG: rubrerythrin-like domain-containing protein [Halobacteriaceae archaeon]
MSDDRDPTYECIACGARIEDAARQPVACPTCGGEMQNISVPRGQ